MRGRQLFFQVNISYLELEEHKSVPLNSSFYECQLSLPQKISGLEIKSYPLVAMKNYNLRTIIVMKIKGLIATRGSRIDLELPKKASSPDICHSFICVEASSFYLYFECLSLFNLTLSSLIEKSSIPRTFLKKKEKKLVTIV